MIQLTELVVGQEIDVKPTKIVAGQEPEKTNNFLQIMYQAATSQVDTTPHVQQILGIAGGDAQDDGKQDDDDGAEAAAAAAAAEEEEKMRRQKEEEERRARAKEK